MMFQGSGPMAPDDELSALFTRGLAFTNGHAHQSPASGDTEALSTTGSEPSIKYSISQHYHHSSHVAPLAQPSGPQSLSVRSNQMDEMTANIILARNGVDPAALFPSQFTLFRQVDTGQQMRLIELWRSSPASYGSQAYDLEFQKASFSALLQSNVAVTSQQGNGFLESGKEDAMDDEPAGQNGNISALGASNDRGGQQLFSTDGLDQIPSGGPSAQGAEPYMVSGYEVLARRDYEQQAHEHPDTFSPLGSAVGPSLRCRRATGPVYQHASPWQGSTGQDGPADQYDAGPNEGSRKDLAMANGDEDEEML